ncbi:MAG: flippase-like domain-containing protein [Geminicoccaceae bacterium]
MPSMLFAGDRLRRCLGTLLAWGVGLGLIAALIVYQDEVDVLGALVVAGWWFPVFFSSYAGTLLLDSLGWRAVISNVTHVGLTPLVRSRWVGVSINALLPAAQIGGEVVRAHLLHRSGLRGHVAAASVIVDLTVGLLMQVTFALIGLMLLLMALDHDEKLIPLGLGLALFSSLILVFAALQRRGLVTLPIDLLERFVKAPIWRQLIDNAGKLDQQIRSSYRETGWLLVCACWRLLGWLWPSLEIWLLFWLLGHPISLAEAVILEAIGQIVKTAGFSIPGGLGVQEGGVMLAASWLTIPVNLALAAMLIRRIRDFVCNLIGLVVWTMLEAKIGQQIKLQHGLNERC